MWIEHPHFPGDFDERLKTLQDRESTSTGVALYRCARKRVIEAKNKQGHGIDAWLLGIVHELNQIEVWPLKRPHDFIAAAFRRSFALAPLPFAGNPDRVSAYLLACWKAWAEQEIEALCDDVAFATAVVEAIALVDRARGRDAIPRMEAALSRRYGIALTPFASRSVETPSHDSPRNTSVAD